MKNSLQYTGPIVSGLGSDLTNKKQIEGRAKRKLVSQILAASLIKIAEEEGNNNLLKTFRNTYYCLDRLYVNKNRLHGKYCKNRICTVCCCIRKAELINIYLPEISKWENPHFLTLTVKSVPAKKLRALILSMLKGLRRIIAKYKKRNQRGNDEKLMGIRSLECNFNPKKRTYNPHFHIIVNSEYTGKTILNEWIKSARKSWVYKGAQCLTPITDREGCLIETVKYGTKIFTEPDVNDKSRQNDQRTVYVLAIYRIIEAMQGIRIFDRFGFHSKRAEAKKEINEKILIEYDEFLYDLGRTDWIDTKRNLPLTEYKPEAKISYLIENCINVELC